jgi:hypothetical protein
MLPTILFLAKAAVCSSIPCQHAHDVASHKKQCVAEMFTSTHLQRALLCKGRFCALRPGQAIKGAHGVHGVAAVLLPAAEELLPRVRSSLGGAGLAHKVTTSLPAPVKEAWAGWGGRDMHTTKQLSKSF